MRRAFLSVVVLAVCVALQIAPQAARSQTQPARLHAQAATVSRGTHSKSTQGSNAQKAAAVPGAVFDATSLGSSLLLDKEWRVGITSDPAAAAPSFDDSTWTVQDAKESIAQVPIEDLAAGAEGAGFNGNGAAGAERSGLRRRRYAWFRLHIRLAPNHGPVALLIQLPVSRSTSLGIGTAGPAVDVFADGQQVEPEGPHGNATEHYQEISRIYDLNVPAAETALTLAVRTAYIPIGYGSYTGFFANRTLHLGSHSDLTRELELWRARSLFERVPRLVDSILLTVLAGFLLALYIAQKGHPEYLWLALHELAQAPIGFVELAGSSAQMNILWYAALVLQLVVVSAYLFFEFLVAFLSLPRRWYIRWLRYTAPILAGVGPILLLAGRSAAAGVVLAIILLGSLAWLLGWSLFIFITLIAAAMKRNFEAGLLLIPLLFGLVGMAEPIFTASMRDLTGHPYRSPLTLMAGPIPIHFASIADFTGILVIAIIIMGRFLRIHRDQERATSELAAARSVQDLMIPREKIATPGFEVDSVYSPANEVGGDFFHVQTAAGGGMLVVIGDVAGKGLKAAMNVSMLMGALRGTAEQRPSRILESLNGVLLGSESFTTCQAAWFGANGELVVANAGHLPPYINSQEVDLPGGLPLGFLPNVRYEEVHLYLHPGDRVLLASDGVVEARQPTGELFGFDRLHNLSNQSAFYIADAARSFGQEDDITVLTVRRLATAVSAQESLTGVMDVAAAT